MKRIRFFLVAICYLVFNLLVSAETDKYRLIIRDNPSSTICIGWNQVSGSSPTLYYGTTDYGTSWSSYPSSKTPDNTVSYKGMSNNFARLTGLSANTAYYFVIKDSEGTSERFWFKTCPNNSDERLSFIAGGDSRNNRTPRVNANKIVSKLRPHAVFFGGDFTDSGTNTQWANWFDDWQYTTGSDGRMIPIVATRGNHESSNNDLVNLFDVSGSNAYYAITFGNTLIRAYTLNTEISISGTQTSWLSSDLTSSSGITWKMAQYHKPMRPHVASKSEGNNQYTYWGPLFEDHGVKLVVECDAHTVKTTWPVVQSTGGGSDEGFVRDDEDGVVFVGEGCWGAPLRSNDDNKDWTRNSGMFNQVKWIFVDESKIEVRTVKVDNASSVGTVNDADIFTAPSNLDVWDPSNGSVVTIYNPDAPSVSVTSPADETHYSSTQTISITASASDPDGSVDSVQFYYNNTYIGSDNSSPYSINWTIPDTGSYALTAVAIDDDLLERTSEEIGITVGAIEIMTSSQISATNDDVEEYETGGSMYMNSSDIELVEDGSHGEQHVGLLFRDLEIPQGVTITSAYIQFTVDETNSGTTNLTIQAHDTDDAPNFTTSSYNVSSRTLTTASVSWSPSSWTSVGVSGSVQQTPDLTSVIQEVVDRGGWSTTSDLAIIINGTGERTAESYDGSSSDAPIIYVTYEAGSSVPVTTSTTKIINQQFNQNTLNLYPNPVYDRLSVEGLVEDGTMVIYTLSGKLVYSQSYTLTERQTRLDLDVAFLQKGIYLLKVQSGVKSMAKKFIKD